MRNRLRTKAARFYAVMLCARRWCQSSPSRRCAATGARQGDVNCKCLSCNCVRAEAHERTSEVRPPKDRMCLCRRGHPGGDTLTRFTLLPSRRAYLEPAPNRVPRRRSDSFIPCSVKATLFALPRGSEIYPCSCSLAMASQSNDFQTRMPSCRPRLSKASTALSIRSVSSFKVTSCGVHR